MGMFDELKDKAEDLAKDHKDVVEKVSDEVIERAGDAADSATKGRFSGQIDAAEQKADDAIN
jgi:hypothetical protein